MTRVPPIRIEPATPSRWDDVAALFGPRGACAGCWCMYWRKTRSEYTRGSGTANRASLRSLVKRGPAPGLLAYAGGKPIGWCALAPREDYGALGRSRVLAPIDEKPVWSIPCFFIAREWRRKGVTVALLRAAADYAAKRGAALLEGYPIDPKKGKIVDVFAWTGLVAAFEKAGFKEAARRSPTRPIMRRRLRAKTRGRPRPRKP